MTTTPNLAITHIAASQNQKEVTANDAFSDLDSVLTAVVTKTINSSNTGTVSLAEIRRAGMVSVVAGSPAPTGDITLTFDALSRGSFIVFNATAEKLITTISGQPLTAPEIPSAGFAFVVMDGVNIRAMIGGAAVGATVYTELGDVPGSYSGDAGKYLKVNATEDGIEHVADVIADEFVDLTDTPANYTGAAKKKLKVNSAGTAIEFVQEYVYLGGSVGGSPTASQRVFHHISGVVFTLPTSLTGSFGKAKVAATAQTDFALVVAGSAVGTMRFAASGSVASFIFTSDVAVAAGDEIEVIAPATPDATLADVSWTIRGLI